MNNAPPADLQDVAVQLRSTFLFDELSPDRLLALAAGCRLLTLEPSEMLIRQGEPGDEMFIVSAGRLRITHRQGEDEVVLGECGRGEYLGEIALPKPVSRTATVTAAVETRLVGLPRTTLDAFLPEAPGVRDQLLIALEERLAWLGKRRARPSSAELAALLGEMLSGAGPAALAPLEGEIDWVTLPRGTTFIREGDPADCLYFLVSGRLRVFTRLESGAEVSVSEICPGESVGEMALLSGAARSAWVATLADSEMLRLSKAGFNRLLATHPQAIGVFTRTMLARLSRRTRARAVMAQLKAAPLATHEECDEVTRTPNLVLRNLKITQMYHRLSQELALLLGCDDANWCTFACNASKTAGYSIRHEELPFYDVLMMAQRSPRVRRTLERVLVLAHGAAPVRLARTVLDTVSDAISAGNLKVFAELAPIFARFVHAFHEGREHDSTRLEAFKRELAGGPTESGGQELLRQALTHYYDAAFEDRPKRRAELVLLGNIKVGLHEQTRLQPNIVEALNAPLAMGVGTAVSEDMLRPALALLPDGAARAVRRRLSLFERKLAPHLAGTFRRVVTRSMMTLRLPYGEVRLGSDVPRLPNHEMFPDVLRELGLPELVEVTGKFDKKPASLSGSRAADWGNLDDRMAFIVDLFRSRQRSLELFGEPFEQDQRDQIAA